MSRMLLRLADATAHADLLIRKYEVGVKAILDGFTHESRHVGGLFDLGDDEAMGIYRELGIPGDDDGRRDGAMIVDVLHQPLLGAISRRGLVPIDELSVAEEGTVLFYVLTMGVVVARRFEAFVQPIPNCAR
jgi:hypothetical protein